MSPATDPPLHAADVLTECRTHELDHAYRVSDHRRAARSGPADGRAVRVVVR